MNVWVLGSNGFVGRHIVQALVQAGHTVVHRPRVDMAQATQASAWLPHLAGLDAVVNAVGVLRNTRRRPIWPTHAHGPMALFDACAQAGMQRVVQVSALGVEGSPTVYARSKCQADAHLLALTQAGQLHGVVLRPSAVIGQGGAATAMFLLLARMPWVCLPAPMARALVQPVHVRDVAAAAAACLVPGAARQPVQMLAGPQVMTWQALVAHWRAALGHSPAWVMLLPDGISRLSARLGDAVPTSPWFTEALTMLAVPNTTDSGDLAALLGRTPTSVEDWPLEMRQPPRGAA